jgi:phospholipase C
MGALTRPITRRRLLAGTTGAVGATMAATLLPPNVRKVLAGHPNRRGALRDIKHVVLLMQENRSFDHYFGTMAGVRGFADPDAMKLPGGRSVFYQPDEENPDGYLLPFHLDTHSTSAQVIPSTSHAWDVQHAAWNDGKMDSWVSAHRAADGINGPYAMGYYTRDDIPFHFALAESFTICDNYFCSMFGPTWPNRLFWMTGTIDAAGHRGGPIIDNVAPAGGYGWTTYPERLEAAGVPWKVYQEHDNYGTNMLCRFSRFQAAPRRSGLAGRGMVVDDFGRFEYDAMHDKLPAVSWILPTGYQSEHPDFTPADGAAYVASKIDAIAANPDVWAKTVFIVSYDENDGLFDHVPPPTPPPGTHDEFVAGMPVGAGFRVPCIVVSPWTAGGWVCSEPFDHTSQLRFLERITGVREPNISGWRRQTFGDMTGALRFAKPSAPPDLPNTNGTLAVAKYAATTLPRPRVPGPGGQRPPRQEPTRIGKGS